MEKSCSTPLVERGNTDVVSDLIALVNDRLIDGLGLKSSGDSVQFGQLKVWCD
ncbi:MAG: hypothetical protein U5M51_10965 [Emticicia sp.]|nr:hypothetical protein [Emticicia sp.]